MDRVAIGRAGRVAGADVGALGFIGGRVLRRFVAKPDVKRERPDDTEQGEDRERPPPADPVNEPLRRCIRSGAAKQHHGS